MSKDRAVPVVEGPLISKDSGFPHAVSQGSRESKDKEESHGHHATSRGQLHIQGHEPTDHYAASLDLPHIQGQRLHMKISLY